MNCERFDELADDYVDGALDERSRQAVETHLEACPVCRDAIAELRGLLDRAAALPRVIDPPGDLFASVRREIGERNHGRGAVAERSAAPSRAWLGWAGLAASLLLLVTAIAVGTNGWQRDTDPAASSASVYSEPSAQEAALTEVRAAEREYLRATQLLLDSLEASGGELSPETAEAIEKNLAIIDQAIDEVRLALADDPANRRNGQVLTALHRQKLQLLLTASRLSS